MDEKRKIFIYDRKEVGILILLGVGVALFAFTLGVHLGKQVIPKTTDAAKEDHAPEVVEAATPERPNRNEVSDQVKNAPGAMKEALDESLRDEVAKTGLQVEKPKPLALPEKAKAEHPTPEIGEDGHGAKKLPEKALSEKEEPATTVAAKSGGRYALQVGSYPSRREADPTLNSLNEQGLKAHVQEVQLKGKGKWYRVLVGEYPSASEADKAGQVYKSEKRIGAFVVVKAGATAAKE